jgi:hypothetical protein
VAVHLGKAILKGEREHQVDPHQSKDESIREGEPPYRGNRRRLEESPVASLDEKKPGGLLQPISMAFACLAWFIPLISCTDGASFLFAIGCAAAAVLAGAYLIVDRRCNSGYVPLTIGAIHLIGVISFVVLGASGWFGPAWLD